jgi:lactate dehydrogenase-like 2-hydroxyacid dehydrogenase
VRYNPQTYIELCTHYDLVRPAAEARERPAFIQALKEGRWGDFHAIFRPFWGTGGEMGNWDAELIELLPKTVKVFASAGAGFDWADTKLLGERGIIYCNSGLAAADAVADFAVAMVISTFRALPWCTSAAQSPDTNAFQECHANATAQSHNLRGHVLGLIGLGLIGQQIAARCRYGFGMEIHYYDIAPIPENLTEALGARGHGSLESLMRASDCVVLCTPAIPTSDSGRTELITGQELRYFRLGGRFVNVARGSLVSSAAVADALDSGQLSSAALDVHPDEPKIEERLKEHARQGRCMLTCHNAGGTVETHKGFEELSMRNIMKVLQGGDAITPVNLRYLK